MQLHMLSTIDNPYDPTTQYDLWEQYDAQKGYNTPAFLARVAYTASELSEADQDLALEHAIDEIITENVLGIYKKIPYTESSPQTSQD